MSDRIRTAPDVPFKVGGGGMPHTWQCMGCGQTRLSTGSRGTGIRKRCAHCVAKADNAQRRAS